VRRIVTQGGQIVFEAAGNEIEVNAPLIKMPEG
jgi:hypothetical protein